MKKEHDVMNLRKKFENADKNVLFRHLIFIAFLYFASCLLLWKCKIGFGNVDESFYLTIPYRLFQGDALFVHEWHLSQMAGVLTYPIVSLYLKIKGSTVGIVLFMRYVCTVLQLLTAVFLYIRLHKINWFGALFASLSYVLYIPFGIMALSYNSMAVMLLVICTTILITAEKHKSVQYVIAGLFFAGAVLCCPYLAFVFILYAVAVFAYCLFAKIRKKTFSKDCTPYSIKGVLFLGIGAAVAACVFAIFVLSRASLSEIIEAFPSIMNDPEHPSVTLKEITQKFFRVIYQSNAMSKYVYPVLLSLFAVCIADKQRAVRKNLYVSIAAVGVVIMIIASFHLNNYINHIMWPLNILALFIVAVSEKRIVRYIFACNWIIGIAYAFCLNATSNQGFYAISSASSVALVGSIMIIAVFVAEVKEKRKNTDAEHFVMILVCVSLVLQLGCQTVLRYKSVFWETDMKSQTQLIEDGHNKGLYVTESKLNYYYNCLDNLKTLEEYDSDKVLFLSDTTWYYLAAETQLCTYSAWMSGVNEHSLDRLEEYYRISPEKLPDLVYADVANKAIAEKFCERFGYTINRENTVIIATKNVAE